MMRRMIALAFMAIAFIGGPAKPEREAAVVKPIEVVVEPAVSPTELPDLGPSIVVPIQAKPIVQTSVDPLSGVEAHGSAIILLSTPGCQPCMAWWSKYAEPLRAAGWQVEKVEHVKSGIRSYPSARIFVGGKWYTHHGGPTYDDLKRLISLKPIRQLRGTINKASSWTQGQSDWTRDSLIDHLANHSNHQHDIGLLQSMTLSELDALHTSDHQSKVAGSRPTTRWFRR